MNTPIFAIIGVIILTFIDSLASLILKLGSKHLRLKLKAILKNHLIFIGIFLYGFTAVLYTIALKFGELSTLFPITSLTYMWVTILSKKYLREPINNSKVFGVLFIVLGVIFIGLGG
tara:strand:- start:5409 stop:5759 length:351 start_codon:yes stop_codon:yes gene_type:complete